MTRHGNKIKIYSILNRTRRRVAIIHCLSQLKFYDGALPLTNYIQTFMIFKNILYDLRDGSRGCRKLYTHITTYYNNFCIESQTGFYSSASWAPLVRWAIEEGTENPQMLHLFLESKLGKYPYDQTQSMQLENLL